jgi:hypothetical protein
MSNGRNKIDMKSIEPVKDEEESGLKEEYAEHSTEKDNHSNFNFYK